MVTGRPAVWVKTSPATTSVHAITRTVRTVAPRHSRRRYVHRDQFACGAPREDTAVLFLICGREGVVVALTLCPEIALDMCVAWLSVHAG